MAQDKKKGDIPLDRPLIDTVNGICTITINRPKAANALQIEDVLFIEDNIRNISDDVNALVITGSGDEHFSAGMHFDTFRNATRSSAHYAISSVANMLHALRNCPLPTVALVNGACLGAAFEVALSCDVRIVVENSVLGLPEVKLGIPSVADAALLPLFVGLSKAREMILTGDLVSVEELGSSFANEIIKRDAKAESLDRVLNRLTSPGKRVTTAQKALFEVWLNHGIITNVATSINVFSDLFKEDETSEAIEVYYRNWRTTA